MTSDDETKALKPTSKEINAVIADMVGVGPLTPGDPDVPPYACLFGTSLPTIHKARSAAPAQIPLWPVPPLPRGFCPTTKLQINLAVFR